MNRILESTKFVVEHSTSVHINQTKVLEFANTFDHNNALHWLSASPLDFTSLSEAEKLNFLFVFNAMSFCYWGDPKWIVKYQDQQWDGSWGMIVAIKRALDEGKPILDAEYRAQITKDELSNILRGNTEIPLFRERHQIMQETGKALMDHYKGSFENMVVEANKDSQKLLELITTTFPSFKDAALYKERNIDFYKRAQLLIADTHQLLQKKGYGEYKNIDQITACADYKLPQALRKFGILVYAEALATKIDHQHPIPHASEEEVEIRANTIWAVEYIKQQVQKRVPSVTSIDINDHLWLYTQTKYPDDKPYHLTRTTCY